jgi:hypothetical protein
MKRMPFASENRLSVQRITPRCRPWTDQRQPAAGLALELKSSQQTTVLQHFPDWLCTCRLRRPAQAVCADTTALRIVCVVVLVLFAQLTTSCGAITSINRMLMCKNACALQLESENARRAGWSPAATATVGLSNRPRLNTATGSLSR